MASASLQVYANAIRQLDGTTYQHLRSVSHFFGVSQKTMLLTSTVFAIAIQMKRYWCGETTGRQAIYDIVQSIAKDFASIGGGFAGGYAGAKLVAAYLGPVGGVFGGLVGSFVGSYAAQKGTDIIISQLGDLLDNEDKLQALKKAFEYLELSEDATIDEINRQYRQLSRKYHPDSPNGSTIKFMFLETNRELIKQSRKGL